MTDLSQIRQKIYKINKKRWSLIENLMSTEMLLTASFYERFTKCSSPNCKCSSGELHGPFPWIYQKRKGEKFISTSCIPDKAKDARCFSENYKAFKENFSQIKKLDEEICTLIMQIETSKTVNPEEFTKKVGEKRGRKQKKSEESLEGKEN